MPLIELMSYLLFPNSYILFANKLFDLKYHILYLNIFCIILKDLILINSSIKYNDTIIGVLILLIKIQKFYY